MLYTPEGYDVETLAHLLEAGVNVVTTRGEFHHPPLMAPQLRERLEEAAQKGRASLFATGSSPGFITQVLPAALLCLERRFEALTIDEFADIPASTSPQMITEVMGFGGPVPEAFDRRILDHVAVGFAQSLASLASAVGLAVEGVESEGEFARATQPIPLPGGAVIEPGTLAGQRITVTLRSNGGAILRFRANWYCGRHLDRNWELADNGWRVQVAGGRTPGPAHRLSPSRGPPAVGRPDVEPHRPPGGQRRALGVRGAARHPRHRRPAEPPALVRRLRARRGRWYNRRPRKSGQARCFSSIPPPTKHSSPPRRRGLKHCSPPSRRRSPRSTPRPPLHYRMRAEFRVLWREGRLHYAMVPPGERRPAPIDAFPIGAPALVAAMEPLRCALEADPILHRRLHGVEFLTATTGEVLATLIYHRPLDDAWRAAAEVAAARLGLFLIGRSRKQKVVLVRDWVEEQFAVADRLYRYRHYEGLFTQPNAAVNQRMLAWAREAALGAGGDLLELYCGIGNFTAVLAGQFRRMLATEVVKAAVAAAHFNLARNGATNADVVRLSAAEMADALDGVRPFRRLAHLTLGEYAFSTLLVDPPRSGLDPRSRQLATRFERILYISCNPQTLARDLEELAATHRIARLALFDQFPHTPHIECGVLLVRSAQSSR
ncbi:MAG: hypothetical protein KatS3mg124_1027 [Porticoccaceae bacterium]|nr:MAG: hypothetical protein KatS3mg124_1027 [Porticoccaceae bacterium]